MFAKFRNSIFVPTLINIDVGVGIINMVKEAWMLSVESKGGMKHISPTY